MPVGTGSGASIRGLERLATLGLALALDLALGEPPQRVHPVVWIGRLVSWLECRSPRSGSAARLAYGAGMALVVPALSALPFVLLDRALLRRYPLLRVVFGALALKPTFAARDLFAHLDRIRRPLEAGDLAGARASLQMIVSRPTASLDAGQVTAAAIESAAENVSDSFVAPLTCYALLGTAGALFYRASNTLDAMIGYHGRYEHLGKASARLDDLLNLFPSRLTALLISLASPFGGGSPARAWRTALRYHGATESPNAGWPMSAAAGALDVQLEKVGHYRLGEPGEPLRPAKLRQAVRIVGGAMALAAVLSAIAVVGRAEVLGGLLGRRQ